MVPLKLGVVKVAPMASQCRLRNPLAGKRLELPSAFLFVDLNCGFSLRDLLTALLLANSHSSCGPSVLLLDSGKRYHPSNTC